MDLLAFSITYLGQGREGTAVLYAPTREAAARVFAEIWPLKNLLAVHALERRPVRRASLPCIIGDI